MEEEEHEVYGGEIPDVAEMEGDVDMSAPDDDPEVKELDEMKRRLKEMEEEATALREMQAKVEKEIGSVQDPATAAASQANKEEADSRSVFVGNFLKMYMFILFGVRIDDIQRQGLTLLSHYGRRVNLITQVL
ncbi:hypothetical protein Ahy_A03g010619 isoform F [Arachis hypogaea]|uniref:Polyadenylate-binding protein n=1 Tax=Arachis hypogaea TaxID=3818 RepID=A0A445DMX6_ARAHY|nr:hypothetical protein Ahy_A03g010619 isoform F [Arachis hypogaea]